MIPMIGGIKLDAKMYDSLEGFVRKNRAYFGLVSHHDLCFLRVLILNHRLFFEAGSERLKRSEASFCRFCFFRWVRWLMEDNGGTNVERHKRRKHVFSFSCFFFNKMGGKPILGDWTKIYFLVMVGIVWCFLVSKLSFLMEHVTFWLETFFVVRCLDGESHCYLMGTFGTHCWDGIYCETISLRE